MLEIHCTPCSLFFSSQSPTAAQPEQSTQRRPQTESEGTRKPETRGRKYNRRAGCRVAFSQFSQSAHAKRKAGSSPPHPNPRPAAGPTRRQNGPSQRSTIADQEQGSAVHSHRDDSQRTHNSRAAGHEQRSTMADERTENQGPPDVEPDKLSIVQWNIEGASRTLAYYRYLPLQRWMC